MATESLPDQMDGPDVDRIEPTDGVAISFPTDPRQAGFQVVCDRAVLDEIQGHGQSELEVEVCGVLVGRLCRDERGPFVWIEANIRGEHAANHAMQVTFTSATWDHIHETMSRLHPERRIVGWYHTHPGFGIFLSAMDRFIHDHFFNLPWQVAYVFDPLRGEDGMFVWRKGVPQQEPVLILGEVTASPRPPATVPASTTPAISSADKCRARSTFASRLIGLLVAMFLAGLVGLAWKSWASLTAESVREEPVPGESSPKAGATQRSDRP